MKDKKKKIIALPEEDFKLLNIQAAHKGKALKPYIEDHLSALARRKIKA